MGPQFLYPLIFQTSENLVKMTKSCFPTQVKHSFTPSYRNTEFSNQSSFPSGDSKNHPPLLFYFFHFFYATLFTALTLTLHTALLLYLQIYLRYTYTYFSHYLYLMHYMQCILPYNNTSQCYNKYYN